ncbi:cysteine proteinase [Metschnikowia bicuspidata var. bicuspidata NRRL YB-4993]|uniref:ubiquitinyl hydrolase 1 n=1 Tax=Metschnikowia bicuspidata var. bicuspidata NRRL YB-4993 TaxID=869754 RepID=A0A1A0GZ08_9ASCO|nr:cysteine proteinase [Metschnikowia bicuspidata var. bicuspidata NRRL YB-4993]OBA17009.1 cysteine proteinase [Metschnikowia bicuspidata var. bicuspidata NRRL YB-4993]
MLKVAPQDGDASYLVPSLYLEKVLETEDASSLSHLAHVLGKLDCSSIVDEHGALPDGDSETDAFTQISPELFHQVVAIFGLHGDPVIRNTVVQDDGTAVLERNPPFFVVHSLNESSHQPRYQGTLDGSNHQYQCSFSLSQCKTFYHLVDAIKTCMFKAKDIEIRVWFVNSENAEQLPPAIPVSMFITDVDDKKIIGPMIMEQTLRTQGVTSSRYHLVAERVNKSTRRYPVDLAIANYDPSCLYPSIILKSGGNLGLSNLGNTCYMNSALQCLVHLPEVNFYFFFDLYKQELNTTNPLGNKGEVASTFSNLLHKLFDVQSSNNSHVTPREFKYTIGRHSSMFHGYQQQDSQEFLSWLLDALHEDLNRIYDKPYLEKPELKDEDVGDSAAIMELANTCWAQHKQRNDSVIVDLFTGLYQSTLVCPDCSKQSITFDPFNDLTLPLPVNKKWYHVFTIVDLSNALQNAAIRELEVELTKSSNFQDLVTYLSDFLQVPVQQLFLFEVFRNYFYKNFQDESATDTFLPVSELISEDDIIIVYIIPHDPSKDIIVPLVNVVGDEDKSYSICEPFGIPLFVVIDQNSDATSFGTIRRKVEQAVKILSNSDIETRFEDMKGDTKKEFYSAEDFPLLTNLTSYDDESMVDVNAGVQNSDSNGYDSDVSLANPNISASLGFEMKIFEEKPQAKSLWRIPRGRPQFANLPSLAENLNEMKRKYYHYPEYVEQTRSKEKTHGPVKIQSRDDDASILIMPESPLSSETERHSFVLVDGETGVSTGSSILNDEDIESDTNYDQVNSLFASVDNFGGPPKPSNDNDSVAIDTPGSIDQLVTSDNINRPTLITQNSMLVIEWDSLIYGQFFHEPKHQAWKQPPPIPNPKLEESKRLLNKQQSTKISLYDCFKNFSTPEVLGEQDLWYCPRCKDHKRATKTIQLWSTGDLLTIHLKRFQSARHFSDKIDMVVDFPIEGLDMSEFVSSNSLKQEPLIYDLVAVDEHYGGLGGGHYTASAKNFRDGKWYKFNDSRVTAIEDPQDCVTGAAYLLFYKKRTSSSFAGGDGIENLLKTGKNDFEARIDRLRNHLKQIIDEIESFNQQGQIARQIDKLNDEGDISASDWSKKEDGDDKIDDGVSEDEEEEDLYADSGLNRIPTVSNIGCLNSHKKSRSPVAEQLMKFEFENQRKQRLISKGSDLPRSVNINMGYSSSISNLASPDVSTDDDSI